MEFSKEEEEEELEVEDWQGRALKSPSTPLLSSAFEGVGWGLAELLSLSFRHGSKDRGAKAKCRGRPPRASITSFFEVECETERNNFDQRFSKEEKGNRMINSDDWLDGEGGIYLG